jgi:enamine deaminase RidA (YjgF/YER057c/UK114 family)
MDIVPVNPPELPQFPGVASHGIVVPKLGLVYTTGQVAWDAEGRVVCPGDLAGQFVKAYENVEYVLNAAGSTRSKIIKETIYLAGYTTDRAEELLRLLSDARQGLPVPPASTTVGVETLYADGYLVEIETVAVI